MHLTFEEYLEFYEKLFGIQLFEYQIVLLRSEYEKEYGNKQPSAEKELADLVVDVKINSESQNQ